MVGSLKNFETVMVGSFIGIMPGNSTALRDGSLSCWDSREDRLASS